MASQKQRASGLPTEGAVVHDGQTPPPSAPPPSPLAERTAVANRLLAAGQQRMLLRTAMAAALAASLSFLWDPFRLLSAMAMVAAWYVVHRWMVMKPRYRVHVSPILRHLALGLALLSGGVLFIRLLWRLVVPGV